MLEHSLSTIKQLRSAIILGGNNKHLLNYALHIVRNRALPKNEFQKNVYNQIDDVYESMRRMIH